jgi:copper chaperone CopZ
MKSIKTLLVAVVALLSFTACDAKIKNAKTETVKIFGNCEMCKKVIEKAGNLKNIAEVDWNEKTKMATLTYDATKTNKEEILKRIALAGYDSNEFLAPNDVYAKLPECCQYERNTKKMAMVPPAKKTNHDMHSSHNMTSSDVDLKENALNPVFEAYFGIKDALVKTDGATASAKAKTLVTAINGVKMESLPMDVHMVWMKVLKNLKEDAEHIADTKDATHQRDHFGTLSKNVYALLKVSKGETPTYYQFCPMANNGKGANWLSKESAIKNPYYGSKMLSCGSTVETIK